MKLPRQTLSKAAQKAIAAFKIINYIRKIKPYEQRFTNRSSPNFQDELIRNKVINPDVVSIQNLNAVMDLFILERDINPNNPRFEYGWNGGQPRFMFYPTATTRTLFNILLNDKRRSIITGSFGLTKNISFHLLHQLSQMVMPFKGYASIDFYVGRQRLKEIPKFVYYRLKEEDQSEVISQLKSECWQVKNHIQQDSQQYQKDLKKFLRFLSMKYSFYKNTRLFYIIDTGENDPAKLLESIEYEKTCQVYKVNKQLRNTKLFKNLKVLLDHELQLTRRPEFIMTQENEDIFEMHEFDRQQSYWHGNMDPQKLNNYVEVKKFCQTLNEVVNYQRNYMTLQLNEKLQIQQNDYGWSQHWSIGQVRKSFRELSILMHDDIQLCLDDQKELQLIDRLADESSQGFTQAEISYFKQHPLIQEDQEIELDNHRMTFSCSIRQEQHGLQPRNHEKVLQPQAHHSVLVRRSIPHYGAHADDYVFTDIYPQSQSAGASNKGTPQIRLLPMVRDWHQEKYKFGSADSKSDTKGKSLELSQSISQCRKWHTQMELRENLYVFKSFEWSFEKDISKYWSNNPIAEQVAPDEVSKNELKYKWRKRWEKKAGPTVPCIQKAVSIQKRICTGLNIQREHFIICPQEVIDALKKEKKINSQQLCDEANKWKISFAAIEEVRFSDFSFHDDNLKMAVDQLFEHFTTNQQ